MSHPQLISLLNKGKKFDIVILNVLGSETGYYLATKFKSSIVLYSTYSNSIPWLDSAIGQPHNPSFMPLFVLRYVSKMNFLQRLINSVATTIFHSWRNYHLVTGIGNVLDSHFPRDERPSLIELEKNTVLALGFTHPLFHDGWRPTNPNYVHLGMMNCR